MAQENEEIKQRVASGKFKEKGILELKIHQPSEAKKTAETQAVVGEKQILYFSTRASCSIKVEFVDFMYC